MDNDLIDSLESISREMGAVALLVDAAGYAETLTIADIGDGLHALIRRWTDTIERAAAGATDQADPLDRFTVALLPHEADALRARAAAHALTPEAELLAIVDRAIQRHRDAEGCK